MAADPHANTSVTPGTRDIHDMVVTMAHAIASASHPRDAVAAAANCIRTATGAEGVALLRVERGAPSPAFCLNMTIPPGYLTETALQRLGQLYPLVAANRIEGIVALAGLHRDRDCGTLARRIQPMLDLTAVALRTFRTAEDRAVARSTVDELAERTRADALRFRALHELAVAAAGQLDPVGLGTLAANLACTLLQTEGAAIYSWDAALDALVATAHSAGEQFAHSPTQAGRGLVGQAYTRRAPVVVADYPAWEHAGSAAQSRLRAGAAVPLWAGEEVIGVLAVRSPIPREFTPLEVETLTLIAAQVGPALASAYYYRQSENRRAMAEALAERAQRSEQQAERLYAQAREAEAHLATQLEFTEAVTDSLGEGLFAVDREGRATFVNSTVERLLGWNKQEVIGNPACGLLCLHRADGTAYAKDDSPLDHVVRSGAPYTGDDSFACKDGRLLPVEVIINPIIREGHIDGAVCAFQDITERLRAQQALEASEARLRQAQKMEAIGLLAGGIAHDFNNLITAIIGFSDIASNQIPQTSPLQEYLKEVTSAGEKAADLTRQLLAFSRQQVLRPEVLDLNRVVTDMGRLLRRLIGENIELITLNDPQLGRVRVDRSQIEQVLVNLAVNARDAMPDGGRLTIETKSLDPGDVSAQPEQTGLSDEPLTPPQALLIVTDTGTGMDHDIQQRIFEPFFTTKEEGKGTGLGLATVYGIVKQSGGDIWVESELGRGTRFHISFPVQQPARSAPEQTDLTVAPSGNETILLTEDEPGVRAMTRAALEAKGYRVLEAGSAEEAMDKSASYAGAISLLIADLVLPGLNGRELSERIVAARPRTKRLFISGHTDDVVVRLGVSSGEAAFLKKPFSPSVLARTVRAVLDSPREVSPGG